MSNLIHVTFVLQDNFSLLAFTAAADALTTANLVQKSRQYSFQTASLGDQSVASDLGIQITADSPLSSVDVASTDYIIVCGGYRCDLSHRPALSELLKKASERDVRLGGLWNGSIALAHAGLMDGFSCTLHPDNHAYAQQHFPTLLVRNDAVVIDRARFSAAGPNSSFDLMLLLIQRVQDSATVIAIRNILRADVGQPPEPAQDHSGQPFRRPSEKLQRAVQLMRNNLDETLHRDDLAAHLNMSTRAMERMFQKYVNTSPARHYMELRLLKAHEMLRQTNDTVTSIAGRCGFVSGAHFSRTFSNRFGCSPKTLRQTALRLID